MDYSRRYLEALQKVDLMVLMNHTVRPALNAILEVALEELRVDAADFLSLNPFTRRLEYTAGKGFHSPGALHFSAYPNDEFFYPIALDRKTRLIPDVLAQNRSERTALLAEDRFVFYGGTPLVCRGQVKGVLEVFHRCPLAVGREWVDFLETLAGRAALAVEREQELETLQRAALESGQACEDLVNGWASAVDRKTREVEGHTRRLADWTVRLARQMGLREVEVAHARRGAVLHDVGKIVLPEEILLKENTLSAGEWEAVQRHPSAAREMMSPVRFLQPALDIPYCHQERWDGSGYPRGLKGDAIPLPARIFMVVDVWDSLLSERPYRSPWTEEAATAHLCDQSGKLYDPDVVRLFLSLVDESTRNGLSGNGVAR